MSRFRRIAFKHLVERSLEGDQARIIGWRRAHRSCSCDLDSEVVGKVKSQTQRKHHWNRYEDEQPDAVGQNKQPRRQRLLA